MRPLTPNASDKRRGDAGVTDFEMNCDMLRFLHKALHAEDPPM